MERHFLLLKHGGKMNKEERIEYLKKIQLEKKEGTYRLLFRNRLQDFSIYKMPINIPMYRLKNGRTIIKQEEYIKTHNKQSNFFNSDDSEDAQKSQHEILKEMIDKKDLASDLKLSMQKEPIILDYKGIIINGNRRTCAMKDLNKKYVECIILPESTTEEEINDLEDALQIKSDNKAEYEWTAQAKRIAKYINQRISKSTIASKLGKTEEEIKLLHGMYLFAKEYLKTIDKESMWSELENAEEALKELAKKSSNKKLSMEDRDDLKNYVFHLILTPATEKGRKYDIVKNINKYLPDIQKVLKESSLDINKFELENSKKIMTNIYQIIDLKKEERRDVESILLLKEAHEKIKRAKAKADHKISRLEFNKEIENIERLIFKFKKHLDKMGIAK